MFMHMERYLNHESDSLNWVQFVHYAPFGNFCTCFIPLLCQSIVHGLKDTMMLKKLIIFCSMKNENHLISQGGHTLLTQFELSSGLT
jgi:hypothetical protein